MFNNLHNFLFLRHFYLLYRFPYDILLLYTCTPQSRVLTFSVGRPAFCCVRENHEKGNKNIMGTAFLRQLQQEFKGYNGQIYPGGRPVYDPDLAERCSNSHGRQAYREQMMRIACAEPSICPTDDTCKASALDD